MKRPLRSRDITRRGTPRKMKLYVHWTQKPGAAAKLAKAVKRRRKTIAAAYDGSTAFTTG